MKKIPRSIQILLVLALLVTLSVGVNIPKAQAGAYDDEFNVSTLDPKWSWVNQDPANWSLTAAPGFMRINCQPGEIVGTDTTAKNILLETAPTGDWTVITKVTGKPTANWAQAGIMVYQNNDNWVKVDRLYDSNSGGNVWQFAKEIAGTFTYQNIADSLASTTSYLKVVKAGTSYSGYWSSDGVTFTQVGTTQTLSLSTIKVGLICIGGPSLVADFDWIHVITPGPTDTPTNTPTNTPVPPTNTPTNTPTVTNTSPPTNTPTNTPVPPTNTPTNTPAGCGGTNVALNKPATASSIQGAGFEASKAVDGNTTTRWSANFTGDPQWIYVDLGSTQSICRVLLNWEAAYATSYQIQTSPDATNWTTIYSTTTGNGGIDDLTGLSGSGRYVRMYGTVRVNPSWSYSLWEFEVYTGSGGPTNTPTNTPVGPTPTWTNTPVPGGAPALSGAGVDNPYTFGTWRGTPVQIWETWNNYPSWGEMEGIASVHTYFTGEGSPPFNVRFPGAMSFSQPMWAAGENANTCNSGVNDGHMQTIFVNLKNAWGNNAWIRLGWEFNGYWFPQNYAPSNPTGWVNCWRRWHGIIKGVDPNFKLVWNPNWGSNTNGQGGFDLRTVYPGSAYVDAAGPDYYDFNIAANATGFGGEPNGITAWRTYIASLGKPFAMPEWGLNTPNGGVDDVGFMQQMYDELQLIKNSPSGLGYESYFNLDSCTFKITDGCNPNSGAFYQSHW